MLGQKVVHAVRAQPAATRIGEQWLRWCQRRLAHPRGEDGPRVLAQRSTSLLAALADHTHVRAGANNQVLVLKAGQLRQAKPRLNGQQDQRVIPAPGPGALIRCGQQRINLRPTHERHECARETLGRYGQHSLDLRRSRRRLERGIAEERVNRGQA